MNDNIVKMSVLVRVTDMSSVLNFAHQIVPGCEEEAIGERVRIALMNPSTPPVEAGYELIEGTGVEQVGDAMYRISVAARVLDPARLAQEADSEYTRCWGAAPEAVLPIGEQLFEVAVGSNASPAPIDVGFEIVDWASDSKSTADAQLEELVAAAGYTICDNGTGSGWYALLPGVTDFDDQNHLGFFSSKHDLLEEVGNGVVASKTLGYHDLEEDVWKLMNQGVRLDLVRKAFADEKVAQKHRFQVRFP